MDSWIMHVRGVGYLRRKELKINPYDSVGHASNPTRNKGGKEAIF